ncbi:MAG TPA: glycosyltransferase [Candidatus Latescibacteria bacterium]|nr:glycosyltransferase [Candidatus Latescibacterota bacterium]
MIRVVHVINTLAPGGAETLVANLCAKLPGEGVQPAVAYLFGDATLAARLTEAGVHVEALSSGERPSPFALCRLLQIIRTRKIQLVHAHLVYAGITAKIAARLSGTPVVMTRHSAFEPKANTFFYRFDNWLTRRYAARLVAVGEEVRATILKERWMEPDRVVLHRNAIDVSEFRPKHHQPSPDGAYIVGTVGRMEAPKAQEVFLEAVARVRAGYPNVKAVIAGDGRLRSHLEGVRSRLGLDTAATFLGSVTRKDIPGLLNTFDVFVLSSDWEGLPLALLEAAASGLPVVATDVGGVHEIVQNGKNGWLVEPGNVEQLARRIGALLSDVEMRERFGRQARAFVETEFDITRLARETAALYREVLNSRA